MWATVPAVVLVTVIVSFLITFLVSAYWAGKLEGWTRITVRLLGLGFTLERNLEKSTETGGQPRRISSRKAARRNRGKRDH